MHAIMAPHRIDGGALLIYAGDAELEARPPHVGLQARSPANAALLAPGPAKCCCRWRAPGPAERGGTQGRR
jgi:hypothetical protein